MQARATRRSSVILILDQGRVLQRGKTEAVFARPASETVARLLGAEHVAFGTGDGIGRGFALAFAKEGARLAVCDINLTALRETEHLIQNEARGFDPGQYRVRENASGVTQQFEADDEHERRPPKGAAQSQIEVVP